MIFKTLPTSVKNVDEKNRIVMGVGSSFGVQDRHGDIIPFGAYAKTLRERGPGGSEEIFFLDQHKTIRRVARFTEANGAVLEERAHIEGLEQGGLYFEIPFPPTTLGNDLLQQYLHGVIRDHSVGIDIVKWKYNEDLDAFLLIELILWELSSVTWGANNQTPHMGVKGIHGFDTKEEMATEIGNLRSCLREGLTEDTAQALELGIKILEARLGAMSSIEQSLEARKQLHRAMTTEAGLDVSVIREAHHHLRKASLAIDALLESEPPVGTQEVGEPLLAELTDTLKQLDSALN